jgi:hypothetical protein
VGNSARNPQRYDKQIAQPRSGLRGDDLEKFRQASYHDQMAQGATVRRVLTILPN